MKKSHKFNELSKKKCVEGGCRKFLKQRLVETKKASNIDRCYKHGMVLKRAKQNEKTQR